MWGRTFVYIKFSSRLSFKRMGRFGSSCFRLVVRLHLSGVSALLYYVLGCCLNWKFAWRLSAARGIPETDEGVVAVGVGRLFRRWWGKGSPSVWVRGRRDTAGARPRRRVVGRTGVVCVGEETVPPAVYVPRTIFGPLTPFVPGNGRVCEPAACSQLARRFVLLECLFPSGCDPAFCTKPTVLHGRLGLQQT